MKKKILILVATKIEASFFKKNLKFKSIAIKGSFELYEHDKYVLVVSGVGKVKAAAAIGFSFSFFSKTSLLGILNYGFAGAGKKLAAGIGDIFLINKILDNATLKEFYPDMIITSSLAEEAVKTFDKPVKENSKNALVCGLVDMEASAVYEAGSVFLSPHELRFVKIVSDNLLKEKISVSDLKILLDSKKNAMLKELETFYDFLKSNSPDDYSELINQISDNLRLSVYEQNFFKKRIFHLSAMQKEIPKALFEFTQVVSNSSRQRKQYFEQIKEILQ